MIRDLLIGLSIQSLKDTGACLMAIGTVHLMLIVTYSCSPIDELSDKWHEYPPTYNFRSYWSKRGGTSVPKFNTIPEPHKKN